tara:strand:+ start:2674 stop:3150 length:477 start_codon:yes stop_codon:yes gene_type:complete
MAKLQTECIPDDDLWFILNNPWSITEAEWRLRDENSRKSMFTHIKELLASTEEGGYSKMWRTSANEPIAILGCCKISEKKYTTFFVCSHHYDAHAMKLSFQMRKTLKEVSVYFKGCTLGIFSSSEHPHLFTWLRFLRFKYKPEENNGVWKYFEYVSPS